MSHIDNALKKAQKEKDNIYQRYSRIVPVATHKNNTGRKMGLVIFAAVALISLSAIALLVFENNARDGREGVIPHENVAVEKVTASQQEKAIITGTAAVPLLDSGEKKTLPSPMAGNDGSVKTGADTISGVDTLYRKALGYQQKGDMDKAGEGYKKVLSIEPEHVFALNNLGVIYMSRRKNKEAADMFIKAMTLKADYIDPYYNLACLYSLSGNISESLHYLKMAASINNSVKNWAKNDRDLKNVRESAEFRKVFE